MQYNLEELPQHFGEFSHMQSIDFYLLYIRTFFTTFKSLLRHFSKTSTKTFTFYDYRSYLLYISLMVTWVQRAFQNTIVSVWLAVFTSDFHPVQKGSICFCAVDNLNATRYGKPFFETVFICFECSQCEIVFHWENLFCMLCQYSLQCTRKF